MPKEVIKSTDQVTSVSVGWSRDNESVQIGVGPTGAPRDGSIESGWYAELDYDGLMQLSSNITKAKNGAYGLENILSVRPYDAPGMHHGEPAYDFAGLQLLKGVVDSWSDDQIVSRIVRDRLYAVDHLGNDRIQRVTEKSNNLLASVLGIRKKRLDSPQ